MKNSKLATTEKNPQQLFEEIQNQDISGMPFDEIRRRMEIVHNAMDYTLNNISDLQSRIADNFQMTA